MPVSEREASQTEPRAQRLMWELLHELAAAEAANLEAASHLRVAQHLIKTLKPRL